MAMKRESRKPPDEALSLTAAGVSRPRGTTVGRTVTLAVKSLAQEQIGSQLAAPLTADETAWLDADLG